MAIHKVCGIETEYGIVQKGSRESNPITASSVLINSYMASLSARTRWDFEDESPGNDARGFSLEGAAPPEVETHLVNAVLTNGARFYVDHAHPEYSSPECYSPREAVLYDVAGERIAQRSMLTARDALQNGEEIVLYKNNSDGKGNSYGCHENYLMDREVPFTRIVQHIVPFFVTRQIICGAGKVGTEVHYGDTPSFQISQRADFFEEEVGLETTLKRPIVNTRDEPHGDARRFRRLHVIVGDANMSQVSTYLKLGTTAIVLAMIEDGRLDDSDLGLAAPVNEIRKVSWDTSLTHLLTLRNGKRMTALQVQWDYLERARKYAQDVGLEAIGDDEQGTEILDRWEATLSGLESDPMSLAKQIDWIAKLKLVDAYRQRHDAEWDDARLAAMGIQYHDMRPAKSLASRLGLETLFDESDVEQAISSPPRNTRAYFRGRCLQKFGESIVAANWDSLVFDVGTDPLRRVPMMDPLRGTAEIVDELIDACETPGELLDRLGA